MMVDRFAIERMAEEQQLTLLRNLEGEVARHQPASTGTRLARTRVLRLAAATILAVALLWGGLAGNASAVAPVLEGSGGGAIGYMP